MKKFIKYSLFAIALLAGVSSCTDDYDYDAASPVVEGNSGVAFLTDTKKTVLNADDNSFTIEMVRTNTNGELTVPLIANAPAEIQVPQSVTFADGEAEAEVEITVGNVEMCKSYPLSISIPQEYTDAYDEDREGFISFLTNVVKEDYKLVANGVFTENILFGESWNQPLEYSEILDIYRLPDLIVGGTNFYFKWDGTSNDDQVFYFCDDEGNKVTSFATGYVHSRYGMIMANVLSGTFIGCDENTLYLPFSFTVSAGSLGADYDTYTITETFE